jgi:hypothetical protein
LAGLIHHDQVDYLPDFSMAWQLSPRTPLGDRQRGAKLSGTIHRQISVALQKMGNGRNFRTRRIPFAVT